MTTEQKTIRAKIGLLKPAKPGVDRAQVIALERAKIEKEAHGEFESEHRSFTFARLPNVG